MKTLIALTAVVALIMPARAADRPLADNDNRPTVSMTKPKYPKKPKNAEADLLALALQHLVLTKH